MKKFNHSDITPEKIYNDRRSFIKSMGYGLGALTLSSVPLINAKANNLNEPNSYEDITTYNNFYEFGTGKAILTEEQKILPQDLGVLKLKVRSKNLWSFLLRKF